MHTYIDNAYIFVKLLSAIAIQKQKFLNLITLNIMGGARIFVRVKTLLEVCLVRGLGAEPPGRRRIFENFQTNFLRKLLEIIIFEYFQKI